MVCVKYKRPKGKKHTKTKHEDGKASGRWEGGGREGEGSRGVGRGGIPPFGENTDISHETLLEVITCNTVMIHRISLPTVCEKYCCPVCKHNN